MTAIKEKKAKTRTGKFDSDENVLKMYLNEINRIPLLTREEENEVTRAAARGDNAARNRLINGNLRFVVSVAKKYQGQGLPLADLISEGNIGLMSAVEHFDADKGYRFISYAVWWVRQSITKALCEKSRLIRLPINRVHELLQIEKVQKMLTSQSGVETKPQKIAQILSMGTNHVEDIINISREIVSLEKKINTVSGSSVLGDFVEDSRYEAPEQAALNKFLEDDIEKILGTLKGKEADVIRLRYGLGEQTPMSLKELSIRFNLSKERVRQIEEKALARLQHPSRSIKLEPYVA